MDKRDKIKLLINFTNAGGDAEEAFRRKILSLPLLGDADTVKEIKEEVLQRFNARYFEYIEAQVDVYERELSEEALDASITFYTSEAGQEIITKMPKVNDQLTDLGIELGRDMMMELTAIMEAYGDDIGSGYDPQF